MELTKTQQYWKAHLDALQGFQGSAVDYARQHGLEVEKLHVYKTAIGRALKARDRRLDLCG
ncbi:MAG: hypothetical protein OES38_16070 [Gammaproteobacteria bacterium]|nr:hypothetical protein [Gammaproteobacteria bacterium]